MRKKLKLAASPALSKLLLSLSLFLFFSVAASSQTVTGTVTDGTNKAVSGVTVQVKGKSAATVTNESGTFSIEAAGTDVLTFSSVGFTQQEVPVNGRSTLTISMAGGSQNLDEVVVTALGISRQARSLGYAVSNVKPEELTVNRTPNLMNALQGKVAGVNISGL